MRRVPKKVGLESCWHASGKVFKHVPSADEPSIPQALVAAALETGDKVGVKKVFIVGVWTRIVKALAPPVAGTRVSVLVRVPE